MGAVIWMYINEPEDGYRRLRSGYRIPRSRRELHGVRKEIGANPAIGAGSAMALAMK